MWKKLSKNDARKTGMKSAREVPAVSRLRTGYRSAMLIMPAGFVTAKRADIYSDGNGKTAYAFNDGGEYAVYAPTRGSNCVKVVIHPSLTDRIPYGTTDAVLTRDGDMWVLDVSQFGLSGA